MSYLILAYIVDEEHNDMIVAEGNIIYQLTLVSKELVFTLAVECSIRNTVNIAFYETCFF